MSLQGYYDNYASADGWAASDEAVCGCGGRGWWLSELDTWHQCPFHGKGARHPEDDGSDEQDAVFALVTFFASAPASVVEDDFLF